MNLASVYIFNLWQLRQWVNSLAQWLEHWIFDQKVLGSNPVGVESFSAMPYFSSLRLSCRKNYNLYDKIHQYAFGQKLFSCLTADLKSKFWHIKEY